MSFDPVVAAPFWFPDAVLLCGLLCTRPKWWWLLLVAILPVRLLVEVPFNLQLWFLGAVYVNDCAKAVLAALLLRRFLDDPIRLRSMRDLGVYFLFAVVLVPALSALGGAATRAGMGQPFWPSFEQWLLGDALASLVVTPILFYWVLRPPNPATFSRPRIIEAALLAIGLLISLKFAFEPGGRAARYRGDAVLRAGAFHGLGGDPLPHVRRDRGRGDVVGIRRRCRDRRLRLVRQYFVHGDVEPTCSTSCCCASRRCTSRRCSSSNGRAVSNSLRDSEQRFRNIAD